MKGVCPGGDEVCQSPSPSQKVCVPGELVVETEQGMICGTASTVVLANHAKIVERAMSRICGYVRLLDSSRTPMILPPNAELNFRWRGY